MVEIGGFVNEFDIRKTQKEHNNRYSIFVSQRDTKRSDSADNKECIIVYAKRLHPFKAKVFKMKRRVYIEFLYPTVSPKPDHAVHHHQPKTNTKDCQRGSLYLCV